MTWLSQNWIWIALAIVAALYFGGARRGHASGRGGLVGHTGQIGHGADVERPDSRPGASPPQAAVDPVGGEAVRISNALTSLYEGRIYYFSSKETRDRFEAAPQEYAHNASGYPVHSPDSQEDRPRRRGGC